MGIVLQRRGSTVRISDVTLLFLFSALQLINYLGESEREARERPHHPPPLLSPALSLLLPPRMASLDADAPAVENVNAGAAAEAEVGGDDVAGLAKAELEKVQAELTAYEEKVAALRGKKLARKRQQVLVSPLVTTRTLPFSLLPKPANKCKNPSSPSR